MADETQQPDSTQPEVSWSPDPAPEASPEAAQEPASIPVEPAPASPSPTGTEPQSAPDPTSAVPAADASPASGGDPAPVEAHARAVLVNNFTRRDDNDALLGSWVDVVAGDYQGRFGAYEDDVSHDPQSGYPDQVLVRTRDAENELIQVAYADIRPSKRSGGR